MDDFSFLENDDFEELHCNNLFIDAPIKLHIDTSFHQLHHQGSASSLNSNCDSPYTQNINVFSQSHKTPQTPQNKTNSSLLLQQSTPIHKISEIVENPVIFSLAKTFSVVQNHEDNHKYNNFFGDIFNEQNVEKENNEFKTIVTNHQSQIHIVNETKQDIQVPFSPDKDSSSEDDEEKYLPEYEYTSCESDSEKSRCQRKSKGKKKTKANKNESDSSKKPMMPCSIVNCNRQGSRLMESLKGALEQDLKAKPSGRVCEAHYRQDLRAYKKNPTSSTNSSKSESMSDDESVKKRKASTPNTRSKRSKFI